MNRLKKILPKNKYTVKMYRFAKNIKKQPYPNYYPTDLNFEMTTYCNSNCLFCTRENLISNNQRPLKHMSMETFHKTLNLFKRLTDEIPPTMLKINPTGLGEPTLHPQLWCALHQVRDEFPHSRILMNTNGVGLNEAQAQDILDSPLDCMCISIRFADRKSYMENSGVDKYDVVVENVKEFLKMRNNNLDVHLQVFETQDISKFYKIWSPLLNENDSITIQHYIDLVGWRNGTFCRKKPCGQPWSLIVVDVDGNIYPCCEGVWIPHDESLCIGNVDDSKDAIFKRVDAVRASHLNKEFMKPCKHCPV